MSTQRVNQPRTHSSPKLRRSAVAMAATAALVSPWAIAPSQAAACTWVNPGAGNWSLAANWSCGVAPGLADTATIAAARTVTVNTGQSTLNINHSGILDITAASLRMAGTLNGTGGVVNIADGAQLQLDSTVGGSTLVGGNTVINLSGPISRLSIEGTGTTTFTSGVVVRGQGNIGQAAFAGGNNVLTNQGRISADIAGGTLTLVNPGNAGSAVNTGIMDARSGGSLVISTAVNNAGGQINALVGSNVVLNGITITGGTLGTTGTGAIRAASNGGNALDGVSITGLLDLASIANARQRLVNTTNLTGAVNIANGGILSLDGSLSAGGTTVVNGTGVINLTDAGARLAVEGTGTTTLATGVTVRGQGNIGTALFAGGNNVLINNGLISADVGGGTLTIARPANAGSFINNGTLQAINGASLMLSTDVTANAGSQVIAGAGSSVVQNGVTINGVINAGGTGVFTAVSNGSNILNNVRFNGNLDLASIANARERIVGTLTLNGAANVSNGGILSLDSSSTPSTNVVVNGNGTINLNDAAARLSIDGTGTSTLASTVVVRGQGNIGTALFVGGNNVLTNNGLISADVGGGTLTITRPANAGSFINNGTLQAINGASLVLSTDITANAGSQVIAGAGSSVVQNGVTINGVINAGGTGVFTAVSSGSNILNNVSFNGNLDLASIANARERIVGTLTLNGAANVSNGGILSLDSSITPGTNVVVNGTGVINLNDPGARLSIDGAGTTTLASTVVVRGQGNIGTALFAGGDNVLTNNGRISADVAGGTLTITRPGNAGRVVNNNTLDARGGGTLVISTAVNNSGGVINALNGSSVLLNGITVTGGAMVTTGTGAIQVASSGANALDGVTLNGLMDMATVANSRQRLINTNTLNGVVNVANGGILSLDGSTSTGGTVVVGGTGVINLNAPGARLSIEGAGTTTLASGLTVRGQGNVGTALFAGGNNTLINNGTITADVAGGTLTITRPANAGTVQGTGTLQANGGRLEIATSSPVAQGRLVVGGAGSSVDLNANNLTLTGSYTNALAGSGNSFDRRAGISGTGQILAGGNAAQAVTGTTVTGGATNNVTVAIGNVRVGANTVNYQIANTGSTGPILAGAIQTSVNGGNITDARLSGAGVTASNYIAGGPGTNSGNLGLTFTVAAAGALAPLTGQAVNLRSNFQNIADQRVNFVLGAGAAAFQAAAGAIQTPTLNFGTLQVGQQVTQGLVVRNTATGAAGFVEDLNASFGPSGNGQITGTGALSGILAGSNSGAGNGVMVVTVTGATAGALNSGIAVNYTSAGAVAGVSNGLGLLGVGSENYGVNGTITAVGNVINQASPLINNSTINLGAVRVGAAAPSGTVSVTNVATAAPQAALNASIASAGAPITASGSFNLLNPGATNSSALQVGLNTAVAGTYNGQAVVSFVSDASNVGGCAPNCTLNLASQNVAVQGRVYSAAAGSSTTSAVSFGIVRVGDTVSARNIVVNNTAAVTALDDSLRANLTGVSGPFGGAGTVGGVAAGGSGNIGVTLNTATAGVFSQTGSVAYLSQNGEMADVAAGANQQVRVQAQVNNLANAYFNLRGGQGSLAQTGDTFFLDYGTLNAGDAISSQIDVSNFVTGPADSLSGSFNLAAAGGLVLSGFSAFAGLLAGADTADMALSFVAGGPGAFQWTIGLNGLSINSSDPLGLGLARTLVIRGLVAGGGTVPEPTPLALLLAAALAGALVRRYAKGSALHQAQATERSVMH
jgi:hypothetical protein